MTIGEKIKNIRITNHLLQKEFAPLFNISRAVLSSIETGKVKASFKLIVDISNKFLVPMSYFIEDDYSDIPNILQFFKLSLENKNKVMEYIQLLLLKQSMKNPSKDR